MKAKMAKNSNKYPRDPSREDVVALPQNANVGGKQLSNESETTTLE